MQLHPASSDNEELVRLFLCLSYNRALPSKNFLIVLLLVIESREGGKKQQQNKN